ncbi:hypothetical protein ACH50O_07925 [Methylomonas sp. 2BW1-5-20]|uniref:hypothetical protein n=1 Tax=Methylomonas sp. 2BW1-5-20 TaxID=3376686 RepID=UPI004052B5CE
MKRKMEESGINFYLMPNDDKSTYADHVKMRAEMFCYLLHKVAHLCVKYKPSKSFEKYLSDTAAVQVSEGVYSKDTGVKIDAAHLCNTSFLCDLFLTDITGPISPTLRSYCEKLRTVSGATTPQLKSDNVGPDKVIDSYQTKFKNDYLKDVSSKNIIPAGRDTYINYVIGLNKELAKSKSRSFTDPNSGGYEGAHSAKKRMTELELELDNGQISWSMEDEFQKIATKIGSL